MELCLFDECRFNVSPRRVVPPQFPINAGSSNIYWRNAWVLGIGDSGVWVLGCPASVWVWVLGFPASVLINAGCVILRLRFIILPRSPLFNYDAYCSIATGEKVETLRGRERLRNYYSYGIWVTVRV